MRGFLSSFLALLSFLGGTGIAAADGGILVAGTAANDASPTILQNLLSSGFHCGTISDGGRISTSAPDRRGKLVEGAFVPGTGVQCIGSIDGYPKPVALLIPAGYQVTHNVELLFYFHGFNTPPVYDMPSYLLNYAYLDSLNASGRNVILVAPLGVGAPPPEFAQLTDTSHPERFKAFIDSVASIIQGAGLAESSSFGTISLMSHSGGYAPIANVLDSGTYSDKIRSVYLLDSLYARVDTYVNFAKDPTHRLWSAYGPLFTPGFTGLPHRDMMAQLTSAGVGFVHYLRGQAPLRENNMHNLTAAEAAANRLGFIQTDAHHVPTVKNFMSVFLAGGAADDESLAQPAPSTVSSGDSSSGDSSSGGGASGDGS